MKITCRQCGWNESGDLLPDKCPSCEHPLEDPGSDAEEAGGEKFAEGEPDLETTEMVVRESTVTISSLSEGYRAPTPFIRLRGKWLERLGWLSGSQVNVQAGTNLIVLSKKAVREKEREASLSRRGKKQSTKGDRNGKQ